ncbi:Paf1-domain-containing protein [Acephala macrosclerotiorum]|nr:Paf1-domain-containing protein [Acephala macrosclerotiorum]
MASSSQQRVIHQDYIARIRYSNALPPPPNPPKLLDIPNTGLASGQYTTPGFASRLARDQPLNIEADAELGMPLDLVGMPGIFDGDESSIQAPLQAPPIHPHDRALLRPLSTLGKPKFSDSGVSFLRRTEYISSHTSKSRFESTTSRSLVDTTGNRKKRVPENLDKESPEYIKNQVERSFSVAAQSLKSGQFTKHPTKKNLKLVDAFPLLPDLTAFPDAGGYVSIKFLANPLPPSNTYDLRLENSILKPMELDEQLEKIKAEARELHERDPERYPAPDETMEYEFYLTETLGEAMKFKRKFDTLDPENDDEDLYTQKDGQGQGCFRFKRLRAYESAVTTGNTGDKYDDEVCIAVHDGKDGVHQKAAYYYPVLQKIQIRPQRTKNINIKRNRFQGTQDEVLRAQTDFVDVRIEDPDEKMKAERDMYAIYPYGKDDDEEDEEETRKDGEDEESQNDD